MTTLRIALDCIINTPLKELIQVQQNTAQEERNMSFQRIMRESIVLRERADSNTVDDFLIT